MIRWERGLGEALAGRHLEPGSQLDARRFPCQGAGAHCDFSHVDGGGLGLRVGVRAGAEVPPPQAASAQSHDKDNISRRRSRDRRKVGEAVFIWIGKKVDCKRNDLPGCTA